MKQQSNYGSCSILFNFVQFDPIQKLTIDKVFIALLLAKKTFISILLSKNISCILFLAFNAFEKRLSSNLLN